MVYRHAADHVLLKGKKSLSVWGKGKLISLILCGSCVNVRSFMFPNTGQTPVFHYGVMIKTTAVTLSVLGQRCPVFGI